MFSVFETFKHRKDVFLTKRNYLRHFKKFVLNKRNKVIWLRQIVSISREILFFWCNFVIVFYIKNFVWINIFFSYAPMCQNPKTDEKIFPRKKGIRFLDRVLIKESPCISNKAMSMMCGKSPPCELILEIIKSNNSLSF